MYTQPAGHHQRVLSGHGLCVLHKRLRFQQVKHVPALLSRKGNPVIPGPLDFILCVSLGNHALKGFVFGTRHGIAPLSLDQSFKFSFGKVGFRATKLPMKHITLFDLPTFASVVVPVHFGLARVVHVAHPVVVTVPSFQFVGFHGIAPFVFLI